MARLKILISGAGIAGNAVAFWLAKLGHDVTVIERFPSLRDTGLQIDLRGHGIEVMKRMGLEKDFRSKSAPEQGLQMVDKSGRRRAYFPVNKSGKGTQSFTTEFEIMRGDLCRLVYDTTKDRAKYIFGTSIEGFEEKDGSLEVRFADGKADNFDLLIGADGQGSHTRKLMLGPDAADAFRPLGGQCIAYFTIPRPIREGEDYTATMYMAPGLWAMTRRHSPDRIQVYLSCATESEKLKNIRRGDVKKEKTAFTDMFQGAGWQTAEILEAMKDADDFYCERVGLVQLDSWTKGRVTLVGDAGYCPSVNTGMGTTSGFVGAYILAGEIGRYCGRATGEDSNGSDNIKDSLAAALKAYEEKFQPFMSQVQEGVSDGTGFDKMMTTKLGVSVLNYCMGAAAFFKVNIFKHLLGEEVKGWDLPEYKMLQS
ncbi:hypothetical protein FQN54_009748 [Arachnomyces sp. PD_36]|nr:hypothetical protein FQN54_009748 [Arachnomyces sp. PD_36]